jgi:hypothetical protein
VPFLECGNLLPLWSSATCRRSPPHHRARAFLLGFISITRRLRQVADYQSADKAAHSKALRPSANKIVLAARFAAVPPDVRKGCAGCALPDDLIESGAMPQGLGRSPGMIRMAVTVGRSRHLTSGGTAANAGILAL